MEDRIPEELLRDILECALWPVPLACYLDETPVIYQWELGGPTLMPPSNVLSVCKRWLRIATPMWYRYIRLASPRQVKTFAQVLRANPALGSLVRHLRLSGHGAYLDGLDTGVLQHMPSVQTLAVTANVRSPDNIGGLLRALPTLNPSRLYVSGLAFGAANLKTKAMREGLFEAMRNWTALERVYLAPFCAYEAMEHVAHALRHTPSVKIISLSSRDVVRDLVEYKDLFARAKFEAIHCRFETEGNYGRFEEMRKHIPEEIVGRVVYKEMRTIGSSRRSLW